MKKILILIALVFYHSSTSLLASTKDVHELVVGVFPRHNYTVTIKMYSSMIQYLNEELKINIKLETTRTFPEFWKNVVKQKYDLVHFNQYHYLISNKKYSYDILLKNEENNRATISSIIIVRKDSGINNLQDLRNKKIIFGGGERAMISYLVPKMMLAEAGLKVTDYDFSFARNPPNALLAVKLGQADACGVGDSIPSLRIIANKIQSNELKIISRSKKYPHLAWAVKHSMHKNIKTQLKLVLLNLNESEQGRLILKRAKLTGLIPASDAEYKPMLEFVKEQ